MLHFRQMPPFVRAMWILGLLLCLISLMMFAALLDYWFGLGQEPVSARTRIGIIALNLTMLSMVCSVSIICYRDYVRRLRQGAETAIAVGLRIQVVALFPLATAPLSAITLAAVLPPTSTGFLLVFPLTMLAILIPLVAPVAYPWIVARLQSQNT